MRQSADGRGRGKHIGCRRSSHLEGMKSRKFTFDVRKPFSASAYVVTLRGTLGGEQELDEIFGRLSGTVVFDLEALLRITSFGVREWMAALRGLRADYYAFTRCRPALIAQFNMVEGFAGRGELVSFYAPYICSACDDDFEVLLDLRRDQRIVADMRTPPADCPRCSSPAVFDDLPGDYFSFVASRPFPYVPHLARQMMDGREDVEHNLHLSKRVDGATTVVALTGSLLPSPSLARKLDGLEGVVVVDLSGLTSASPEGFAMVGAMLAHGDVTSAGYRGVRVELVEDLRRGIEGPPRVASIILHGSCTECRAEVDLEVDLGVADDLDRGAATCLRCGARQSVPVPRQVAAVARGLKGWGASERPYPSAAMPRAQPAAMNTPPPAESASAGETNLHGIVAVSAGMRAVIDTIAAVAGSDATVLVRGETGTGKEMLTGTLHRLSGRHDGPLVAVNCAALPEGLVESELFGHEPGAFTGATGRHIGRFERANGGTLFIDEVGDLPAAVQVKLLRVLQEGAIERLGGREAIAVDVRLVAATHRDLETMIQTGEFREDLYYRLNVVPVTIPPLRERREDIWPLAQHYLEAIQARYGKSLQLTSQLRESLEAYDWPGNIRQLINVIERMVALTPSGGVATLDLAPPTADKPDGAARSRQSLRDAMSEFEKKRIAEALDRAGGNRSMAARELGISRQALNHKLQKYNL